MTPSRSSGLNIKRCGWQAAFVAAVFSAPLVCAEEASVGAPAPAFSLTDSEGQLHRLADHRGSYVVLEWYNPECPFVRKHYDSGNMQALQSEYAAQGVTWFTVSSAAPGKQGHATAEDLGRLMEQEGSEAAAALLDAEGAVGKAYGAKTTPHMFIIDPQGVLLYAGAIDSIPSAESGDIDHAENYVRAVLDAALAGETVEPRATQPYGCSVKY